MLRRSTYLLFAVWLLSGLGMAQERVLIQGGTLVDVRDGTLRPNTTVVIDGDRIASLSRDGGQVAAEGIVIDARGKYILPGYIDLHVHYRDWAAELYLNHGVTTAVDLGAPHEWIKAQREGIERGTVPGPRLFISTNNLDGPPDAENYYARGFVEFVDGPEEALRAMQRYAGEGVDAVKVYDGLSIPSLRAIVREAEKANIPVIGHFKDVRTAIDVGVHGVEHLNPIFNALVDEQEQAEALRELRPGFLPREASFMDASKVAGIVQSMVDAGLYLNPTLRVGGGLGVQRHREKGLHYEDFELLMNNWGLRYVPLRWKLANLKEYQEMGLWHWADLTQEERDLFHRGYENARKLVKAFVDAGGKLYAGTDSASMSVPGLSLHQELDLIVDCGVSPLQAVQAVTIHPAELMRMEDKLGTIEVGKVGDVVVLDANPLEDIRNTRKIHRVISRGRVLEGEYHADFKNPIPKNDWEGSSHFFPSPRIRWATPEAFEEGERGARLTVHGTGFIPYSFVRLNGEKLQTEFVNEQELQAEVPSELLEAGTYAVTVENPDFGWGSNLARGAGDIAHLGIRGPISNEFLVLVKPQGGAPIFPHPREQTR